MKKSLLFILLFQTCIVFAQSKKEQIKLLTARVDSLIGVIKIEEQTSSSTISNLNQEISRLKLVTKELENSNDSIKRYLNVCNELNKKLIFDYNLIADSLTKISKNIIPEDIDTNTFNEIFNSVFQDSIIIASDFSYTPFHLNEWEQFSYFQNILSKSTKKTSKKIKNLYKNKYIKVDKIYWGKSYVEIFGDDMILNAEIIDENISLMHDIKIGQTLESICEKLNINFKKNRNYKFIEITNPPTKAGCSLCFYFKNNILIKVIYLPYTG